MINRKVRNGYTTVVVSYDRALKFAPAAQCGVVLSDDGSIHFISYTTRVITIDKEGWIECTGTYSQTTRKQIGKFLKEYAPVFNYYTMKQIAETGKRINLYTGEIK